MTRQNVLKGYQGRRKNGVVNVCSHCSGNAQTSASPSGKTRLQEFQSEQATVAIVGLVVLVAATVVLIAVRGH